LCELYWRFRAVGLVRKHTCELPATQVELADAAGLSTVHVNRTLQHLRADGLIKLHSQSLWVLDWPRLQAAGDFDPSYLQLHPEKMARGRQDAFLDASFGEDEIIALP
jgi:hypothetical protein